MMIFCQRAKQDLENTKNLLGVKKNSAALALDDLLKSAKFSQIFLSYNNEGIISPEEIRKIMSKYGKYECFTKEYRGFKADSKREHKANSVVEYLHFLEKI